MGGTTLVNFFASIPWQVYLTVIGLIFGILCIIALKLKTTTQYVCLFIVILITVLITASSVINDIKINVMVEQQTLTTPQP